MYLQLHVYILLCALTERHAPQPETLTDVSKSSERPAVSGTSSAFFWLGIPYSRQIFLDMQLQDGTALMLCGSIQPLASCSWRLSQAIADHNAFFTAVKRATQRLRSW
jgi:hypothetical protein